MLIMPDNPGILKVIGIDPGTENLGFSVFSITPNFEIINCDVKTIVASKNVLMSQWTEDIQGARYARLNTLGEILYSEFLYHTPISVAVESPFYNPRRPAAFEALVQIFYVIRKSLEAYDNWREVYPIDPSSVKNAIGAHGAAGKVPVKEALLKVTDLNYTGVIPLENLDEHSIDALAVGYTRIQRFKRI